MGGIGRCGLSLLTKSGRLVVWLACLAAQQICLADELAERVADWQARAALCPAPPGLSSFPTKPTGRTEQPCDDGDMTLFNGLLCAAGEARGCAAVADAQDPQTGEWFRSPRIRVHGNDRGGSSFSPDMALGVQLYLVTTKDVERARKWLVWLHDLVPCSIPGSGGGCRLHGLPRFCTDKVCTLRPGDGAILAQTVTHLQRTAGMGPIPNGRLRGFLGTFSGLSEDVLKVDASVNKAGFSQHLTGVSVFLHRKMGSSDRRLSQAVDRLVEKNPRNAFFVFLKEGANARATGLTLEKCPAIGVDRPPPLIQWQWERSDAEKPWEQSCYWDCIFMARLLGR